MIGGATPDEIRTLLHSLADVYDRTLRFVQIGGGNLAIRGLKDATKDLDIVVLDLHPQDGYRLVESFRSIGFDTPDGYYLPGATLDAATMFERPEDGMWIDLFLPRSIIGGLDFSGPMRERVESWSSYGDLQVDLADLETVFLLKSITGRWRAGGDRDLDDLKRILAYRPDLDWAFIQAEWDRQLPRTETPDQIRANAIEAMDHIRKETGRRSRWRP